jgi:hypothetical protein
VVLRSASARGRGTLALACGLALAACNSYDSMLLPPLAGGSGGSGGAGGMDASTEDAGDAGNVPDGRADACVSGAVEMCNRIDDDCDGEIDDGANVVCEQTILHALTECVAVENSARCVLIDCRAGYDNCDGNPANGCEPYCSCNACDDAGAEDAGE